MKRLLTPIFLIIVCLMFVFSANSALAFSLTPDILTNTVCPGSTIVIEDVISSEETAAFTVTSEGTASSFSTTVPTGSWVEGGKSKAIYSYVTPPSTKAPGIYHLKVNIESEGEIKTADHKIIVENCHGTFLRVEPTTQTVCACEQAIATLYLSNRGNYIENYQIAAEGPAASWTNISSRTVTLNPNSETTIKAFIMSACNVDGTYGANFIVRGKSPFSRANARMDIEVIPCYDYSLRPEKTFYELCEADSIVIPVTIQNLGTKDNEYRMNVAAPGWVNFDQRRINVAVDEEGSFNLVARPPFGTEGSFTADVEVLSDLGDVLKREEVNINVMKCYNVHVNIEEDKVRMCNALGNVYSVIIKNTGNFENSYDLSIEGPEWAMLREKHIILAAGAEKAIELSIHPPFDTESESYEVEVTAQDPVSGNKATDIMEIETLTAEDCYKPQISSKEDRIDVPRDSSGTALFIVENKGTEEAKYNIEISGTATSFSQINPGAIKIKPLEAETLYLYIAPPIDTDLGDYKVTVTARLDDTTVLSSKTITVRVIEMEELGEPEEFPPIEEEGEEEPGPSIWSRFLAWLKRIFTPKQAPEEEPGEEPEEEPTPGENFAPVLKEDIPDITIAQGESYTFNLEDHFSDPNGDVLTYLAIKPENIQVTISQTTVTIIPDPDFEGQRELSFYASDGLEITESNKAKVIVGDIEVEEEPIEEEPIEEEPVEEEPVEEEIEGEYLGDISGGIEISGLEGDIFRFIIKDEQHTIEIKEITEEGITFQIASDPFTEYMEIGETKQFDIDGNGEMDLEITLNDIVDGEADFTVKEIGEPIPEEGEEEEEEGMSGREFWNKYKVWIIIAIIIVIIIIIIATGLGRKIVSFFEEEVEVKENNKKK